MNLFLDSVLVNAVVAAALAMIVWLAGMVPAIRRRPGLNHALWLVVLLKFVTPPLFSMPLLPAWMGDSLTGFAREPEVRLTGLPSAAPADVDPASRPQTGVQADGNASWPLSWTVAALIISGVGTMAILGCSLLQVWALRRALKHGATNDARMKEAVSQSADCLQIDRTPAVMILDAHVSPLLWVRRTGPLIVIPRKLADSLTEEQLTCVLSHEIAHYLRRDHFTNALSFLVAAACWWNPVVWLARRELRMAQEACCDALVISRLPRARKTYAQALFQTLEFLQAERSTMPSLSCGFGGKSTMERRFEMIANPRVNHRLSWWGLALLLMAMVALPTIPAFATVPDKPGSDKPGQEKSSPVTPVLGGASQIEPTGSSDRIKINGVEYQRVPAARKAAGKDQDRPDATLDTLQTDSRIVRLNLQFDEKRRAEMKYLELFVSNNAGKTWKLAAANTPDRSGFDHLVPDDGTYWYGLRITYQNGVVSPAREAGIVPAMKVRVVTNPLGAGGVIGGTGSGSTEGGGTGIRSRE